MNSFRTALVFCLLALSSASANAGAEEGTGSPQQISEILEWIATWWPF
jgi:hypothetical protein